MQQLVRKYILKKLKSFVPDLNEHQISVALTQGYLQLDNMDMAPLQIDNFIISATVSCFIMKLQWSSLHLKAEIQNIRVMVQKAQGSKRQEKSDQSRKSNVSIPISIGLEINDVEINFVNVLIVKMMQLKCEIKNRQNLISGELGELNLKFNYKEQSFAWLCIEKVRWDVNLEKEAVQTSLECVFIKDTTNQKMQKLVKFCKIGLNISKNVYNKPLVRISVDKGVCHWNAKVIHSFIYGGIDFALQFIKMPEKQQIRQTDMENPDSLAISIEVKSIKLYCQNNYTPLGMLQGFDIAVFIKVSKYIGDVIIEGRDLCYCEQSNYPHQMVVKKGFPMIRSEELAILIKIYDDYCPLQMINNDLYNFVEIKLKKGQIHYMQQPFLRFMDWLIEQFISLIIKDYGVTSIPLEVIEQKLRDHRFTSIKLSIEDICAFCKPISTSEEGLKLVCSSFALHTDIRECNERSTQMIWETLLCMEVREILISVIGDGGETVISQMMNCELIVSKCGFSQLSHFQDQHVTFCSQTLCFQENVFTNNAITLQQYTL